MTAIITNKMRILNASAFKENLELTVLDKNLYFFIGRPIPWIDLPETTTITESDITPPFPLDTVELSNQTWQHMVSMKKVIESGVSHLIRRRNWDDTGNTIYFPYNDRDPDLHFHPTPQDSADALIQEYQGVNIGVSYTPGSMYVMTDPEYNVYKCLEIGRDSSGTPQKSVDKPTGTATTPFRLADGYVWKYMFTVPGAEVEKFVTNEWIPVKTLEADDGSFQWQVQQAAVSGAIESIIVTAGGSDYINTGDEVGNITGTGASTVTLGSGQPTDNYYNNSTIHITAGTGAGQSRKILSYVGSTQIATLESDFTTTPDLTSVYEVLPTIEIDGDGSSATAKPYVQGGVIERVDIIDGGSDYHFATAIVTGGGPIATGGEVDPVISPSNGHGSDPITELNGNAIGMTVQLQYNEGDGDFIQDNDYRQIGLVSDVYDYGTTTLSTAQTLRASPEADLDNLTGTFLPDEVITLSGGPEPATAKVLEFDGTGTPLLKYFQDETTGFVPIISGMVATGQTSGATATLDVVRTPEVERFSGDLVYIENRRPITRSVDQLEDVRMVIIF